MKRALLMAFALLLTVSTVFAQGRVVTGTVTAEENGDPVPGVNVLIKGQGTGTVTDIDGKYSINVDQPKAVLVFTFIGLATEEIVVGSQSTINMTMTADIKQLTEVVVTALGITREKASLGYAVQEVGSKDLTAGQSVNAMAGLSGKVAGVQISGGTGNMGGSQRVLIRGANSVTGNNQPLYVIDGVPIDNSDFNSTNAARGAGGYDYGGMANDINPEDIESMNVLKGPSAAALYGSRAANGVIMITTKKGTRKQGIGVSVNSSVTFEKVNRIQKLQRSYGGGLGDFTEQDGNLIPLYRMDESWGPKYDGQMNVVHWDGIDDANGYKVIETREWKAPDNDVVDFFETGVALSNSVALNGANDKGRFRLSYTNLTSNGYMPNSELKKNSFNFSGDYKLHKRLTANSNVSFVRTEALGRPGTGYDGGNVMQQFGQWGQRQLDMKRLSNYKNADGSQRTWNRIAFDNPNPQYSDNPYWTRYENYQNDERDRLFGNFGLNYEVIDGLNVSGKVYYDGYTFRAYERTAVGSQAQSYFGETVRVRSEMNFEGMANYTKQINDDFNLSAMLGVNKRVENYRRNTMETSGGLVLPGLYSVDNSVDAPVVSAFSSNKIVTSVFGNVSLGYKSMLYLDATARNDWSSTLPEANNSYFYPSVTGSFVVSELPSIQDISGINFLKARVGWAKVGNDTDPYQLREVYTNIDNSGPDYSIPNTYLEPNLKPESTYSWEVGLEGSFLDNRLTFDVTYYDMKTVDQIVSAAVSGSTGYYYQKMNAGEMTNKGIEFVLGGDIVRSDNGFNWNASVNFARNRNKLVKLDDEEKLKNYRIANAPFLVSVNAKVGEAYGAIMGTDFIYDDQGRKVVDATGRYLQTREAQVLGTVMPDFNLGFRNAFSYKGFDASVLIDVQQGGSYWSTSNMWGMYSGMIEATTVNGMREDGLVLPNTVTGTVTYDEEGNYTVTDVKENETNISAYRYGTDHYSRADAQNIFDASYMKLREVTIGYSLPKSLIGPFQKVRVGAFGRNLAIWGLDNENFDPETAVTSSGNIQGIEGGALPSTATFGFNVSANF
ncbi:SusC/RagA family TonB-linked outer membrane protein [Persicobacter psychrovividus]|uniref:SusC/RagA family TonB-linked outer membrane protein n=1 Tax=Persicobacter psychrovividus TaxID=387638 RepID=A0ABM7VBG4_9BACT|nr:SusC/RagA family TonB-linked outer membrane protein [Persicobacter psychrovividus]